MYLSFTDVERTLKIYSANLALAAMDKIQLSRARQTLEAANVSGCILVYLDDKPSIRLTFSQKLRVCFDIVDESETFVSDSHPYEKTEFDDTLVSNHDLAAERSHASYNDEEEQSEESLNISRCMGVDSKTENSFNLSEVSEELSEEATEQSRFQTDEQSVQEHNLESEDPPQETHQPLVWQQAPCVNRSSTCAIPAASIKLQMPIVTKKSIPQSKISCSYCLRVFTSSSEKEAHHRVPKCLRRCNKCKKDFFCEADLFVHQCKKHGKHQFPSFKESLRNELQCPLCTQAFPADVIHHHIQTKHYSDESFSCCICKSNFKTHSHLASHLKNHHLSEKRKLLTNDESGEVHDSPVVKVRKMFKGQECKSLALPLDTNKRQASLSSKEKTGLDAKYNCKYCSKMFKDWAEKNDHRKVLDLEVKCPKCPAILNSQASLIIHDFQVHEKDISSSSSKSKVDKSVDNLNMSMKSLIRCPLCHKQTIQLKEHIAVVHIGEMLYQCCVCGEKVLTTDKLRRHSQGHLKMRGKFHCSKCPMILNNHSEFFRHAATHRTQCVFCNTEFGHAHLLWSHYESQHADELFTCKTCGKKIPTQAQFDAHMKHHRYTYVKPCPVCGIMIKGKIDEHMQRMHHGKMEQTDTATLTLKEDSEGNDQEQTSATQSDNQYLCSVCPKTLPTHRSLMEHLRKHDANPITCPTCAKKFSTNSNLTKHIDRVHLNITAHTCEICGKKATSSYNLKVHMRIHSITKLFFCELCGQGFNYKASLQGHMKSKHRGDQV